MILNTAAASFNFVWDVATLAWVKETQTGSGASNVYVTNGLSIAAADYISLTSGATTDTYVFKSGGSGGTTVTTILITYTDSTKATISTVAKS